MRAHFWPLMRDRVLPIEPPPIEISIRDFRLRGGEAAKLAKPSQSGPMSSRLAHLAAFQQRFHRALNGAFRNAARLRNRLVSLPPESEFDVHIVDQLERDHRICTLWQLWAEPVPQDELCSFREFVRRVFCWRH